MAVSAREKFVSMAKLAEQAERYEEMVELMEKASAAVDGDELTVEEQNLLSVAYKNMIGTRRASWRIISSIEQKEESRSNDDHVSAIRDYRSKIETELSGICDRIFNLLDSRLIPAAASGWLQGLLRFCLKPPKLLGFAIQNGERPYIYPLCTKAFSSACVGMTARNHLIAVDSFVKEYNNYIDIISFGFSSSQLFNRLVPCSKYYLKCLVQECISYGRFFQQEDLLKKLQHPSKI